MDTVGRTFRSKITNAGMRNDVAYSEKRLSERKALLINATLHRDGVASLATRTIDISTNGMCLLAPKSLTLGDTWRICFDLCVNGAIEPIEALAVVTQQVIGAGGVRIGFQFTRLNMGSMIAISRYVN